MMVDVAGLLSSRAVRATQLQVCAVRSRGGAALDFRHLEYFAAVVAAGSVSRAAAELGMSQPPLSSAITKLEKELGVKLLDRTSKGVQPTNAGMHLLKHGTRLLSSRDRLADSMRLMGDGLVGDLHLGVEPMVINAVIADVLAEFMLDAPKVHVRMLDIVPNEMIDRVRDGDLDLACVPFGPDEFADFVTHTFSSLPVVKIPVKLAVPADRAHESHPGGYGWGRWILPLAIPAFFGMYDRVTHRLKDDPSFNVLEVSTPQTALPFVAAGLGVAPTTNQLATTYSGVTVIDAPAWLAPHQATMLWRRGVEVTPMMKRLLDVTKAVGARRTAMERRYA